MSYTLSLIKAYGYKLSSDEDLGDTDELLERVAGVQDGEYRARSAARQALGVKFELYSWGDEMPRLLAASASIVTVYDHGIMEPGAFEVGKDWRAKLDRVVESAGLKTEGEPRWYFLARYF